MGSRLLIRCHVQQVGSSFVVRSSSVLAHSLYSDTQVDHLQTTCRCATMVVQSQSSDLSLQPRFRSARDQLRLYLSGMRWQHTQKRYFLLDTSMIPGSWTLVTLQALLEGPIERSKHDVESDTLNMSSWWNLIKRTLYYVLSPSSDAENTVFVYSCCAKSCQTCEILDIGHERSSCSE